MHNPLKGMYIYKYIYIYIIIFIYIYVYMYIGPDNSLIPYEEPGGLVQLGYAGRYFLFTISYSEVPRVWRIPGMSKPLRVHVPLWCMFGPKKSMQEPLYGPRTYKKGTWSLWETLNPRP